MDEFPAEILLLILEKCDPRSYCYLLQSASFWPKDNEQYRQKRCDHLLKNVTFGEPVHKTAYGHAYTYIPIVNASFETPLLGQFAFSNNDNYNNMSTEEKYVDSGFRKLTSHGQFEMKLGMDFEKTKECQDFLAALDAFEQKFITENRDTAQIMTGKKVKLL